jgi:hypothetical protein
MGQKTLSGSCKCVEEVRVGWGVWLWAIMGVERVEGGKGPTCAWFKGFRKVWGWNPTFTWRAKASKGN